MKQFISQLIPIVILFLILAHSIKMARFSHSVLGKLIAVAIIVFYTHQNKLLGLLACALFIFYYQSDSVENMLNVDESNEHNTDTVEKPGAQSEPIDDGVYLHNDNKKNSAKESFYGIENMENYSELYPTAGPVNHLAQDEFRKENCQGGTLKYKGMSVPNEMASHVFPEVKFSPAQTCNVCSKTCDFSIIESKLDTENSIMKPVFSANTM
jgi:hypothetical protein